MRAARSLAPALLTSPALRRLRRGLSALPRRVTGAEPVVHYFHQVGDPYSDLAVRALPHLETSYGVCVEPHLVPPPDAAAAPDAERLDAWALRDAGVLAEGLGLAPPRWASPPDPALIAAGEAALAGEQLTRVFVEIAGDVGAALGSGRAGAMPPPAGDAGEALARGAALRRKRGHYLGATFFFEGEWYWGLDRLPALEARLSRLPGHDGEAPFVPRREVTLEPGERRRAPVLDVFLSFRSPYTWLAMPRAIALAGAYGAELRLRFVLPMVMRGLPVPAAKRLYIVMDAKREAERLGLPFGRIADPVGAPTERGLAVLHRAIGLGKGPDFALSFLRGVFAEGVDAGTDRGLLHLCVRAGLDETDMRDALSDESWRAVAEANRAEMLDLGLWGVPSFRVDDGPALWGQDRLWRVEEELRAAAARQA